MRDHKPARDGTRQRVWLWSSAKQAAREATMDFLKPATQILNLIRRVWRSFIRR